MKDYIIGVDIAKENSDCTVMSYKGFLGSIYYNTENDDNSYYGRILNIDDVIVYGGSSIYDLQNSFMKTVDTYISQL